MPRISLLLLSIILLAGCANEGKFIAGNVPNTCGTKGHTFVMIHYGDGRLTVLPIVKVTPGAELQYRLLPGRSTGLVNYADAMVTITSKASPVPPFPAPPADAAWVKANDTAANSGGVLKVCVPPSPVGTSYYYKVAVTGVGELDPRADVQF